VETPIKSLSEIVAIARSVGWGAAKVLRAYYRGEGDLQVNEDKKGGPVTAADLATNRYITESLQKELGTEDFDYLTEETYKGTTPLPKPWVWIIDPLDGTRDFIDKTGEYAIHIALTYQSRPVLSVVVLPELEKLYYAVKGEGTYLETPDGNITPVQVSDRNKIEELSLVVSRTHRDQRFQDLIENLPIKGKNYVGSVGCKIAHILSQESDIYISLSGKSAPKDWDFAAPELILTEAGGKFTLFNGDEVLYNQGDVKKWGGYMASNGKCHNLLCEKAIAILAKLDNEL
jgi:3'(2'), 5'-bisphosphate nucleotidase